MQEKAIKVLQTEEGMVKIMFSLPPNEAIVVLLNPKSAIELAGFLCKASGRQVVVAGGDS